MYLTKRVYRLVAILSALWLLLSGHFEGQLLFLGACSCVLVTLAVVRMDAVDGEHHFGMVRIFASLRYAGWLIVEIVKSNVDVARRILAPDLPISPTIIRVPASQATELGRVIYANSITLTPGTLSIDVSDGEIEVHALNREAAEVLANGEMNRRICEIENVS